MKIISDVNPRWFLLVFFESLKASGLVPTLTPSDELLLAVPRLRLKNWWIFPKHHFSSCMFTWNCWSKFPSLRKGIRFFFFAWLRYWLYILWPMKLTSCYLSFTLRCDVQCHLVEDLPKVLSVTPRKHRSFPMISGLVLPHDSGEWTTGAEAKWRYSWRLKIRNEDSSAFCLGFLGGGGFFASSTFGCCVNSRLDQSKSIGFQDIYTGPLGLLLLTQCEKVCEKGWYVEFVW